MSASIKPCDRCGCDRTVRLLNAPLNLCKSCVSVLSKAERSRWRNTDRAKQAA